MFYCQKVNYTADWGFLLTDIVCVDPGGALESQKLASAEVREPAPPCLRRATLPLRCPARRVAPCAVSAALCAAPHARLPPLCVPGPRSNSRWSPTSSCSTADTSCSTSFLLDVLKDAACSR
eukprot:scaffold94341_cov59-Phaeocystis_antarctica.AAC.6